MRLLIGTPVHVSKDYAMAQWVDCCVTVGLPRHDVLLLDNSPQRTYADLAASYGWRYQHHHFAESDPEERVARANEQIRQTVLADGYDYWFAWDCDLLLPTGALATLVRFAETNAVQAVVHAYPDRLQTAVTVGGRFGCALLHRTALHDRPFEVGHTDPQAPHCWHGAEPWFLERVVRDGGQWLELRGVIRPIVHLRAGNGD